MGYCAPHGSFLHPRRRYAHPLSRVRLRSQCGSVAGHAGYARVVVFVVLIAAFVVVCLAVVVVVVHVDVVIAQVVVVAVLVVGLRCVLSWFQ